jgi:cation-transporting ATPase 13A2
MQVLQFVEFDPRVYSKTRVALYWTLVVLSGGLLWLVSQWFEKRKALFLLKPSSAKDAEVVIITTASGDYQICPVEEIQTVARELRIAGRSCLCGGGGEDNGLIRPSVPLTSRMIVFRHTRFLYREERKNFTLLTPEEFVPAPSLDTGLTLAEADRRLTVAGNAVIELPMPSDVTLLLSEAIHPFFVFQIWAIIVWLLQAQYIYCGFIFFTAVGSAVLNFLDVKRNLLNMHKLSRYSTDVNVLRGGVWMTIDSADLVPGDLCEITSGMKAPCDMVLVQGSATVTEGILTGESTVVIKTPASLSKVHEVDTKATLFGGTSVVELRTAKDKKVIGSVVRTGFESVKGRLVLSVLFPQPLPFKFTSQALIFIGIMFILAVFGFGYTAWEMSNDPANTLGDIVLRGCDMVTIAVPPALPLALTAGLMFAVVALGREKIACISPSKVNLAGKVNCVVFDKTGTLTTEGLELATLQPSVDRKFQSETTDRDSLPPQLITLLSTCHSLTHVHGKIAGDPLEVQTFKFTGSELDEPHTADLSSTPGVLGRVKVAAPAATTTTAAAAAGTYFVLRQFEFQPALQRMGVLVRNSADGSVMSYVKGSPEMICKLSDPATVPVDFEAVLKSYTHRGYRVLGAAYKPFPSPVVVEHPRRGRVKPDIRWIHRDGQSSETANERRAYASAQGGAHRDSHGDRRQCGRCSLHRAQVRARGTGLSHLHRRPRHSSICSCCERPRCALAQHDRRGC